MTMKVRIEDKEALDALSWKALKAYLDRTGWQHAKEFPGKGVIYKRTGPDRRLREIAVPLRRDFADYASRMGDAVGTLARVEDRSELDVYEDLHALGAKMESSASEDAAPPPPAVDEAARAVHRRIRKWLAEEGWQVEDRADPQASFNVVATLQEGPNVNIFQHNDHVDRVTISQHWRLGDELKSEIAKLPHNVQRDVVWNVYRDSSIMGVEFYGVETPITDMVFRAYVYFDGLTKDALIQRILLTIRALHLSIRAFMRALEKNHQSAEVASSLLHLMPRSGGSLTVAS